MLFLDIYKLNCIWRLCIARYGNKCTVWVYCLGRYQIRKIQRNIWVVRYILILRISIWPLIDGYMQGVSSNYIQRLLLFPRSNNLYIICQCSVLAGFRNSFKLDFIFELKQISIKTKWNDAFEVAVIVLTEHSNNLCICQRRWVIV